MPWWTSGLFWPSSVMRAISTSSQPLRLMKTPGLLPL